MNITIIPSRYYITPREYCEHARVCNGHTTRVSWIYCVHMTEHVWVEGSPQNVIDQNRLIVSDQKEKKKKKTTPATWPKPIRLIFAIMISSRKPRTHYLRIVRAALNCGRLRCVRTIDRVEFEARSRRLNVRCWNAYGLSNGVQAHSSHHFRFRFHSSVVNISERVQLPVAEWSHISSVDTRRR